MAELEAVLPRWRERVEAWQGSEGQARHAGYQQQRRESRESLREWITRFCSGQEELEPLRLEFHQRTRTDWSAWGLKGPQAAMFLNMLAKNLDRHEQTRSVLAAALERPASIEDAGQRIRSVVEYLEGRIAAGDAPRGKVHPTRATTLLAGLWNALDPEWPMYWRSARDVFKSDGLLPDMSDTAAHYEAYCRVYQGLMEALGLSAWDLESLCAWAEQVQRGRTGPRPSEPKAELPKRRVWLISPGAGGSLWSAWLEDGIAAIPDLGLGDLRAFPSEEALAQALRELRQDGIDPRVQVRSRWDFSRLMAPGDLVFAKKGRKQVLGAGVVRGDYRLESRPSGFNHVRSVDWTHTESGRIERNLITKYLTEITPYAAFLRELEEAVGLAGADEPTGGGAVEEGGSPAYTRDDALADLFLDGDSLDQLLALLQRKRNVVLQGPPGTGKTYVASRLARLLIGGDAPEQVARVQFHQSMTYEDFVQGFRPAEGGGFVRKDGPFLRFCNLALQDQDTPYVLLIDEINRGNLSRILGELMILIEPDKRSKDWGVTLSYATDDEEPFWVPPNLHIIGTMNTADRSLALVDYALRRRFAFFDLPSAVHSERFGAFLRDKGLPGSLVAGLQAGVAALNKQIRRDPDLGAGFELGHSYFCDPPADDVEAWLDLVVRTELDPLLREYWFDAPDRVDAAVELLLEGIS